MSWHIQHRPQALEDVAGNRQTIAAIGRLLKKNSDDIPRAWLLNGPSGCGKTTVARIMTKQLGATPGLGLLEQNAANFRGIDDMRAISEQIRTKPVGTDKLCIILDECHQLTPAAQNVLLKDLEDTPPYICFLLCTTDPSSLLDTIINRCKQFVLKPLQDEEMEDLLISVLAKEKAEASPKVISHVIARAGGSSRTAINMLESAVSAESEEGAISVINNIQAQGGFEGEFPCSEHIVSVLLSGAPPGEQWEELSRFLRERVYRNNESVVEIKRGMATRLGWALEKQYKPSLARAVFLLEDTNKHFSKASLTALVQLMVETLDE